jgi:hypothetical protein
MVNKWLKTIIIGLFYGEMRHILGSPNLQLIFDISCVLTFRQKWLHRRGLIDDVK